MGLLTCVLKAQGSHCQSALNCRVISWCLYLAISNGQWRILRIFVLLLLAFVPVFGKHGRSASILGSVDEEYMQQEAIIKSVQWASNMKGGEVFQEEHVWVLLGILRASDQRKISESAARVPAHCRWMPMGLIASHRFYWLSCTRTIRTLLCYIARCVWIGSAPGEDGRCP